MLSTPNTILGWVVGALAIFDAMPRGAAIAVSRPLAPSRVAAQGVTTTVYEVATTLPREVWTLPTRPSMSQATKTLPPHHTYVAAESSLVDDIEPSVSTTASAQGPSHVHLPRDDSLDFLKDIISGILGLKPKPKTSAKTSTKASTTSSTTSSTEVSTKASTKASAAVTGSAKNSLSERDIELLTPVLPTALSSPVTSTSQADFMVTTTFPLGLEPTGTGLLYPPTFKDGSSLVVATAAPKPDDDNSESEDEVKPRDVLTFVPISSLASRPTSQIHVEPALATINTQMSPSLPFGPLEEPAPDKRDTAAEKPRLENFEEMGLDRKPKLRYDLMIATLRSMKYIINAGHDEMQRKMVDIAEKKNTVEISKNGKMEKVELTHQEVEGIRDALERVVIGGARQAELVWRELIDRYRDDQDLVGWAG